MYNGYMKKYISWTRSHVLVVFGIIVVIIVAVVGILSVVRAPGQSSGTSQSGKVSGEVVCLPHRGAGDGPRTLECAIGLRGDDGKHYGLRDQSNDHRIATEFFGKYVEVSGNVQSGEDRVYDTVGTIDVNSVEAK